MSQDAGDGDGRAEALRAIHDELAACPDLRPGPVVDDAFRRLVRLVVETPDDEAAALLDHVAVRGVVDDLRALCYEGEYQLEVAWAARIASSTTPEDELDRFPFVANYRLLHEMEREAVARLAEGDTRRGARRVAFVGSGPLPLTAFLLAGTGARVDNLDRDADALAASRRVADVLGVTGLEFVLADATAPGTPLDRYDMVVLAALVGRTPSEKARVIAALAEAMAPGSILLVRSASGLRTLLYPAVDPGALAGFEVLGTVHPTGEVINSVIVARAPLKGW